MTSKNTRKHGLGAAALIALALGLTACGSTTPDVASDSPTAASTEATVSASASSSPTASPTTEAPTPVETTKPEPASAGTALATLETLPVSSDMLGGYDRDLFAAWIDLDGNGCDAREDALARYMSDAQTSDGCKVETGTLVDPYNGHTINYVAGGGGGIDIDHVVALSAGWKTGMANASSTVRDQFSNDPLNLIPTDAGVNRFKGDADAAEWLPSEGDSDSQLRGEASHDCSYVARQVAVKAKYSLFVTPEEKQAMSTVLSDCPEEKLPTSDSIPTPDPATMTQAPVAEPSAPVAEKPAAGGATDPDMGSCAKAKGAGYGPYIKGQDEEYGFYRDGDGDGTVCE